jgi:hypothetical protein
MNVLGQRSKEETMKRAVYRTVNQILSANPVMWVYVACTALAAAASFVIYLKG